jgi:hypothetical protein
VHVEIQVGKFPDMINVWDIESSRQAKPNAENADVGVDDGGIGVFNRFGQISDGSSVENNSGNGTWNEFEIVHSGVQIGISSISVVGYKHMDSHTLEFQEDAISIGKYDGRGHSLLHKLLKHKHEGFCGSISGYGGV